MITSHRRTNGTVTSRDQSRMHSILLISLIFSFIQLSIQAAIVRPELELELDLYSNQISPAKPASGGASQQPMSRSRVSMIDEKFQKIESESTNHHVMNEFRLREALRRGQRVAEKSADHLIIENWLIDNINDLHRELKQTENDFEHYVQITRNMLATILSQLYPSVQSLRPPHRATSGQAAAIELSPAKQPPRSLT